LVALLGRHALGEIDRVRNAEPEQPAVEILAALGIGDVDAEMPEPPDAERPRQLDAADVELLGSGFGNALRPVHDALLDREANCTPAYLVGIPLQDTSGPPQINPFEINIDREYGRRHPPSSGPCPGRD